MCRYSRLYPTRDPIAAARLSANTGALFPMKSEIRPWTVPPVKTNKETKKLIHFNQVGNSSSGKPHTYRWSRRHRTTRTGGRPQPPSNHSCCSGRKEARRRRSSWPVSDMHKPENTAVHRDTESTWSQSQNAKCSVEIDLSSRLTQSTPGRQKAWIKPIALGDSARGSSGSWTEWYCLLYTPTSTSSSSSLISGLWLSVSVSTGLSPVSDSKLKPKIRKHTHDQTFNWVKILRNTRTQLFLVSQCKCDTRSNWLLWEQGQLKVNRDGWSC